MLDLGRRRSNTSPFPYLDKQDLPKPGKISLRTVHPTGFAKQINAHLGLARFCRTPTRAKNVQYF